jgi:hypothetical protein
MIGFSGGYNAGANTGLEYWLGELKLDFIFAGSDLSLIVNGAKNTYEALVRR